MFQRLQIPYRRERWLVGLADVGLHALRIVSSPLRSRRAPTGPPRRILLLRLERVGDLVMVLDAIDMVRGLAPRAQIDLVVGSWNAPIARLIRSVDSIETLDVPWMARGGHALSWSALVAHARTWRSKHYDLAINFEPDIRSNLLLSLSGAARMVGFASGGGGAMLTDAIQPDPTAHIAACAVALVTRAFDSKAVPPESRPAGTPRSPGAQRLHLPDDARRLAAALIGHLAPGQVAVGIQPATGRRIKEWDPVRFAEVGVELARRHGAVIVLIGSAGDRPVLDAVRATWPHNVPRIDLPADTDLVVLAAVLERLALFVTGDTGPMHLAAAVGTPVLAIFGPSLPTRYAPLSPGSRILRIDIPCSPCNLMRRPPERCIGHVPDCLAGIESARVIAAATEMLGYDVGATAPGPVARQASTVDP